MNNLLRNKFLGLALAIIAFATLGLARPAPADTTAAERVQRQVDVLPVATPEVPQVPEIPSVDIEAEPTPTPEPPCKGWDEELAHGVCYSKMSKHGSTAHVVRADMFSDNVRVAPELVAGEGRAGSVSAAARNRGAVVAVNSSFSPPGVGWPPFGVSVFEYKYVHENATPQWTLAIDWQAKSTIRHSTDVLQESPERIKLAFSGSHGLVYENKPADDFGPDNTGAILYGRHPRTAVGTDKEGKLFLAVVDGRSAGGSAGMTMPQLADFMADIGSWHAINLDGGGSSVMAVNGAVANSPSDGTERPVPVMIGVYSNK